MKSVLAVDDVSFITKIYKNIFESAEMASFTLDTANSLQEAKELLFENDYKLFIIDWMLGGENGLDLVRFLKEKKETATIPILMVSSNGERQGITEAAKTGINGYIIKPIDKRELVKKILALTAE